MAQTIKKSTLPSGGLCVSSNGTSLSIIDYKEYPEFMFAMIASYLTEDEADVLRPATGEVIFRHIDEKGNTYKNGLLHSYDDNPAFFYKEQKNGTGMGVYVCNDFSISPNRRRT